MRCRTVVVPLAVVVVALAGCGSNNASTTTTASTNPVTTRRPGTRPPGTGLSVKSVSYKVPLAGFSGGSTNGAGLAVISIKPSTNELCWEFSQLVNVNHPTIARIYDFVPSGTGTHGLPLGSPYTPSGCTHEPAALLEDFSYDPQGFRVSVHDAQFPGGAVRGTL